MELTINHENVHKSFGLPEGIDPNHEYVYRSGEHGIYDYWYVDMFGNYWQYTNAPKDHPHYDPHGGEAMILPDQPMPHTTPQFYTREGRKLHVAVPQDAEVTENQAYDPENARSIWYAMYKSQGSEESRFVYYDSDIRENLDLWVQYQLRLADAILVRYRQYAVKLFESKHPKDKIIGFILMLVDQGCFEAYELTQAKVEDVDYIGSTVKILGRKLMLDPVLLDFLTSITSNRESNEPLFVLDTKMGRRPIGVRHIYSVFKALRVSPHFLLYWHASHLYSKVVHRLAAESVPPDLVEDRAMDEVRRILNVVEDVSALVDVQLKDTLSRNYAPQPGQEEEQEERDQQQPTQAGDQDQSDTEAPMEDEEAAVMGGQDLNKAFVKAEADDFGVLEILGDLTAKKADEFEFSQWLHATPLHDVSDEEMGDIEEQMMREQTAIEQMKQQASEDEEGAVGDAPQGDPESEGAAAQPSEDPKPQETDDEV